MSNLIVPVFVHGGSEPLIARHLQYWKLHGGRVILLSPTDKPIQRIFSGVEYVDSGTSGHNGPSAISRIKTGFNWVLRLDPSRVVIHEIDSFCLNGWLPDPGGGILCTLFENRDPKFKAKTFPHLPFVMSGATLERLCDAMRGMEDSAEHGFFDRYMALACENDGIELIPYANGESFSQNSVEVSMFDQFREAIKNGATFLHGVKSNEAFAIATGK